MRHLRLLLQRHHQAGAQGASHAEAPPRLDCALCPARNKRLTRRALAPQYVERSMHSNCPVCFEFLFDSVRFLLAR